MPGLEFLGPEEVASIKDLFFENGGVLCSVGLDHLRKNSKYFTRDLEDHLREFLGVAHVQAVSSGTAAVYIALKALKIQSGDEVITSAFNFIGDIEAILLSGAVPVPVEIGADLQMCPIATEAAISSRTKAIIVPHMMGEAAQIDVLLDIARRYNLYLIEDACQALGGQFAGKPLGTIGDIGVYSLDYGKIVTSGEGGILVTRDANLHKLFNAAHNHGRWTQRRDQASEPSPFILGFNFRMTELQAAVGLTQLQKLTMILNRVQANHEIIFDILKHEVANWVEFRPLISGCKRVGDTITILVPDVNTCKRLRQTLVANQVPLKILPNDLNWHFAGRWQGLWQQSCPDLPARMGFWRKTEAILNTSLAFSVRGLWNREQSTAVAKAIVRSIHATL